MSKSETKPLSPLPLVIGGVLVVALLGFAFWRMTNRSTPTPAATPEAASVPAAPSTSSDDEEAAKRAVPRVSVPDLRDKLAKNEITLIDVRDADSYIAGHIPGALHIPLARIDGEIPYLPKDKPIVTYCT